MISLADCGDLGARVRMYRGRTHWLFRACVSLVAGSALLGQQAHFQGSVPMGVASPTPVALTLGDASRPAPQYGCARLRLFSVFDYGLRESYRAAKEGERAAQRTVKDAHDLVVQSVANAYLWVIAGSSRVQALRAQVETDQATYDRTADQKRAGTTAAIDVLRAHVELQQEQQQLIAQENQVAKDKLALGRVIGLPPGQQFAIADTEPYSPLAAMTPDQALRAAYEQRADFQSAKASMRAADEFVNAARAERYPNVGAAADYGDVGTTLRIRMERLRFKPSRNSIFLTAGESAATSLKPGRP